MPYKIKIAIGFSFLTILLNFFFAQVLYAEDYIPGFKAGMESFRWEEFRNGEKLLKESGNRFTFSFSLDNSTRVKQGDISTLEFKLYQGTVDYNGSLQIIDNGRVVGELPHQSETDYFGYTMAADFGRRKSLSAGNVNWDFIIGANLDTWKRTLQGQAGYQEQYLILNAQVATGPSWHKTHWRGRLVAGIKLPFYTNEAIGDFNLEPEGRTSPFVKFCNRVPLAEKTLLAIDLYYDSYRFEESPVALGTINGLYGPFLQPDSNQDVYGIQIGISGKF